MEDSECGPNTMLVPRHAEEVFKKVNVYVTNQSPNMVVQIVQDQENEPNHVIPKLVQSMAVLLHGEHSMLVAKNVVVDSKQVSVHAHALYQPMEELLVLVPQQEQEGVTHTLAQLTVNLVHGVHILNVHETVVVEPKTEVATVTTLHLNMAVTHVLDLVQKFEHVIPMPAQSMEIGQLSEVTVFAPKNVVVEFKNEQEHVTTLLPLMVVQTALGQHLV